jgi:hypothetical protein
MNSQIYSSLVFILMIWSISIKGLALWRAARSNQSIWFIVMVLPLNTVGILELVYLFRFAKKPLTIEEIRSWIKNISQKKKNSSK